MKTTLPLHTPLIATRQNVSNVFATLDESNVKMLGWALTNFIQLQIDKYKPNMLEFYTSYDSITSFKLCPWLRKDALSFDIIKKKWHDMVSFITDSITAGYYVYIIIDEYNIKAYDNYNKNHFQHPVFIYGFDYELQVFNIADFFANRKYSFSTASFDEIESAVLQYDEGYLRGVLLLKEENRDYWYYFSINGVITYLNDYLYSKDSQKRNLTIYSSFYSEYSYKYEYGLNVIDVLIEQVKKYGCITNLSTTVLIEHKVILKHLLVYLNRLGYVLNIDDLYKTYDESHKECEFIRNINIKLRMNPSERLKEKLIHTLQSIKATEEIALTTLLNSILTNPQMRYYTDTSFTLNSYNVKKKSHRHEVIVLGNCIEIKTVDNLITDGVYPEIYIDGVIIENSLYNTEDDIVYKTNSLTNDFHKIIINSNDNCIITTTSAIEHTHKVPKVSFIGCDHLTQGNWQDKYGTQGYIVPAYDYVQPMCGDSFFSKVNLYKTEESPIDINALRTPDDASKRRLSVLFSENHLDVHVLICGDKTQKVSFYLWNYNAIKYAPVIEIIDFETNEILLTVEIGDISTGTYYSFDVLGYVVFRFKYRSDISNQERKYGEISGLFFD